MERTGLGPYAFETDWLALTAILSLVVARTTRPDESYSNERSDRKEEYSAFLDYSLY